MDFHLDRQIRFSEESEYQSLYKWSIQEIDKNGERVGGDQIPKTGWSYFTARELRYNTSIKSWLLDDSDAEKRGSLELTESESIIGTLRPGLRDNGDLSHEAIYSMFGTNRRISEFKLHITKLEDYQSPERCRAFGTVERLGDVIEFSLHLHPDRFDRLVDLIKSEQIDVIQLTMNRVPGFYSNGSPSMSDNELKLLTTSEKLKVMDTEIISDRTFKVLTAGEEHTIELPEDSTINLPVLEDVFNFELYVVNRCQIDLTQDSSSTYLSKLLGEDSGTNDSESLENDFTEPEADPNLPLLIQLAETREAVSRMQLPLWLVVILLGLIFLSLI
jgi:hypothetical protein